MSLASSMELLVEREGEQLFLRSPEVGTFTCVAEEGALLWPHASAGVLHTLGRRIELLVPSGIHGRVTSKRPALVHAPVGYGTRLYELEPLESGATLAAEARSTKASSGALVFRTPYAGRFWHRASPEDPAFVEDGASIEAGATVGLIEVMKTFTQLQYQPGDELPARARILRILVEDGAEVREGAALLELEQSWPE